MNHKTTLSAVAICSWYQNTFNEELNTADVQYIIEQWPELERIKSRVLTADTLVPINNKINTMVTGRRRHLHSAKESLCFYLSQNLQWQIPKKIQKKFTDKENLHIKALADYTTVTEGFVNWHQVQLNECLTQQKEPSIAIMITQLCLFTAPLPLEKLACILKSKSGLSFEHPATLTLVLSEHDGEVDQLARFRLSPLCAKLLSKRTMNVKLNTRQLKKQLLAYLHAFKSDLTHTQFTFLLKNHWYNKTNLWVYKDMFNPQNQFALSPQRYAQLLAHNHLNIAVSQYKKWDLFNENKTNLEVTGEGATQHPTKAASGNNAIRKSKTHDHKILLQIYKQQGLSKAKDFIKHHQHNINENNLVWTFLYEFVKELIVYGGVKKDRLEPSSIEAYSAFFSFMNKHPLSLEQAIDEEAINLWGISLYNDTETAGAEKKIYRFLQYVHSTQLGEMLDINHFTPPLQRPCCDANLVTPQEYRFVENVLDEQEMADPFQWLCTKVALSLAYHGKLRRGEALRLRVSDCEIKNKQGFVYRLKVQNTKEGKVKNKHTRYVYLSLPEHEQLMLNRLIKIKQTLNRDLPLLGYKGETLSQRNTRYINPIGNALKKVCGNDSKFHHLRHGGILVLFFQGMRRFNPSCLLPDIFERNEPLLSKEHVATLFDYWLKYHPREALNSNAIYYQIANMIGHQSFATTRASYLHGHEWLPALYPNNTITINLAVLRWLWDMPENSTDVFRKLKKVDTLLSPKKEPENHQYTVHKIEGGRYEFSRPALEIITQQPVNQWQTSLTEQVSNSADNLTKSHLESTKQRFNTLFSQQNNSWSMAWLTYLKYINYYKKYNKKPPFDVFNLISNYYQFMGKAVTRQGRLTRKQKSIISLWLSLYYKPNKGIILPINQRVGADYNKVIKIVEFSALSPTPILYLNRKTAPEQKLSLLKTGYQINTQKLQIKKINSGQSHLRLTFNVESKQEKRILTQLKKFIKIEQEKGNLE